MKMTSKWRWHKNENYLKNEDDLKNEDNLKNEGDLKNEDDLKMKMTSKMTESFAQLWLNIFIFWLVKKIKMEMGPNPKPHHGKFLIFLFFWTPPLVSENFGALGTF